MQSQATGGDLIVMLQRKKKSASARRQALEDARADLRLDEGSILSPVCVAYALIKGGARPEEIAKLLSWRDFEALIGAILRSSGLQVRENLVLTKPRVQIDVVATGPTMTLSIDCKHYARDPGPSALAAFAKAQLRRSSLLRRKSRDSRPIASVILSMSEGQGTFVHGVAVVPTRALRSFLNSMDSYAGLMDFK